MTDNIFKVLDKELSKSEVYHFKAYDDKLWYWFQHGYYKCKITTKKGVIHVYKSAGETKSYLFEFANKINDKHSSAEERKMRNKAGESMDGHASVFGIYLDHLDAFLPVEKCFVPIKGNISMFPADKTNYPYSDLFENIIIC